MKKAKSQRSTGRLRRILLSKQFCITVLVLMSLLAIICLTKVILGFLPVKYFAVEGNTHYEVVEVSSASGIKSGDKLYRIDSGAVEEELLQKCPYIKEVKIKKQFPNTLCFVIEEKEPGWYIELGGAYFSLDYDMELLALERDVEKVIKRGMTRLVLPELEELSVGQYKDKPNVPVFASDDEHLRRETLEIIDTFRTHSIKSRLTKLDLTNRFEISIEIDGCYEVNFGDASNFETKMKLLDGVLGEAQNKGYVGGTITWTPSGKSGQFFLKGKLPALENNGADAEENG